MNNPCINTTIFDTIGIELKEQLGENLWNNISETLNEAKILYSNAKFYYSCNEFSGALVSYSCAAVLLNTLIRSVKNMSNESTHAERINRVSSYSTNSSENSLSSGGEKGNASGLLNQTLNCCLTAVEILQKKIPSFNPTEEKPELKDWEKICTKLQPLVFKQGSNDCLFFNGVAGLIKEKETFRSSLIFPLMYPNLYPAATKGILLYGPPGTGKTYLVKAAVNELQKIDPKINVLFFNPSPGDLKGKYVGQTEKKIEEWFTCASKAACDSQLTCKGDKKFISVMFMDEFDAIARDRSNDPTGLAANSVNTLLQMMDGINSKKNVTVIAATNYPWELDAAVLRRFDTQIFLNLPNERDIRELLNIEIKKIVKFREIPDKNAYCNSEMEKYRKNVEIEEEEKPEKSNLVCNSECVEEPIEELANTPPYNQLVFDFYNDIDKNEGFVEGLVQKLKADNFSNSDIVRLVKAAVTYTGQLCVKANLFYSATSLLKDYDSEKYISCITKLKNPKTLINKSMEILTAYLNSAIIPNDIYEIDRPDLVSIKYQGDDYVNIKCFLYKSNDLVIDEPMIKDVFIKYKAEGNDNDSKRTNYMKQIVYNKKFDMVITFDFLVKETKYRDDTSSLLPVSTNLIENVFNPIYGVVADIKSKIEVANKKNVSVGGGDGLKIEDIKPQTYQDIKNSLNYLNVDDINNIVNNTLFNFNAGGDYNRYSDSSGNFLNETSIKIVENYLNNIDRIEYNTNQDNYDLYNYLLLYKQYAPYYTGQEKESFLNTISSFDDYLDMFSIPTGNSTKNFDYIFSIVEKKPEVEKMTLKLNEVIFVDLTKEGGTLFVYLPVALYKNLIKSYNFLEGKYKYDVSIIETTTKLLSSLKIVLDNNLLVKYDLSYFVLLFKDSIDLFSIQQQLDEQSKELDLTQVVPKAANITKKYALIQLYINDIFNYYNLMLMYETNDDNRNTMVASMNSYLQEISNQKTGSNPTSISFGSELYYTQLIFIRLYDNFCQIHYQNNQILTVNLTEEITTKQNKLKKEQTLQTETNKESESNMEKEIKKLKKGVSWTEWIANQKNYFIEEAVKTAKNFASTANYTASVTQNLVTNPPKYSDDEKVKFKKDGKDFDATVIEKDGNNTYTIEYIDTVGKHKLENVLANNLTNLSAQKKTETTNIVGTDGTIYQVTDKVVENDEEYKKSKKYDTNNKDSNYTTVAQVDEANTVNNSNSNVRRRKKGGGSKSAKHHREIKNKTLKANKKSHSVQNVESKQSLKSLKFSKDKKNKKGGQKETTVYYGGDGRDILIEENNAFINFCLSGGDAGLPSKIVNKKIFIKTVYDLDNIKNVLRKNGYLNTVWYGAKEAATATWNRIVKTSKDNTTESENERIKILEDIKKKGLYLPMMFKSIQAIGFLENSDNEEKNRITDDNDIIRTNKAGNVVWSEIKRIRTYSFTKVLEIITVLSLGISSYVNPQLLQSTPLTTQSPDGSILNKILGTMQNYLYSAIFSTSATTKTLSVLSVILTADELYSYITAENPSPEDVIDSFLTKMMFTIITEIQFITVNNLNGTNATKAFIQALNEYINSTQSFVMANFYNRFKNTSAINNIETVSTPITLNTMTKSTVNIDINNKLTNLNIPLRSFAYALTVVKTTYVKESGMLLQKYYDNKDKFMEEQKKKLKEKRG